MTPINTMKHDMYPYPFLCLLQVLESQESKHAANEDDGVKADAHVGLAGAAGAGLGGGRGGGGLCGGVVGLFRCKSVSRLYFAGSCVDFAGIGRLAGKTYTTLESADKQTLEDLAGLIAVADVFEGFGRVLPADVEEHFFTAGVFVYEAWCCARSD